MRKLRENLPNRVYHLISRGYPPAVRLLAQRGAMRGAHRAFFLDAGERTRFVELLKRVAAFSGVKLLAYCVMTNHVHILIFVPEAEELSDDEVLSRMRILYRDSRFAELRREWDERLKLGRTAAFLRFRSTRTYFTLKYLSPLVAGGYIAPVGKGSPSSSRRTYKLTRKGKEVAQW